jgi:anti-anti-sigma factor
MKIENEDFKIKYEPSSNTVRFYGSLRLNDLSEFNKIKNMMLDVYELDIPELILDLRDLEFMNSAGISTLCKFVFEVKDRHKKPLKVVGNKDILWQQKSLENLKIIWDEIHIDFE